eukprot:4540098-Amphidinium_carterae.1
MRVSWWQCEAYRKHSATRSKEGAAVPHLKYRLNVELTLLLTALNNLSFALSLNLGTFVHVRYFAGLWLEIKLDFGRKVYSTDLN